MKKMRKLIPAFAMLMVAAIMMTTASYAWFSMSTTADATGMKVQATASSSLVIAGGKLTADFATADQDYAFNVTTAPSLTPITGDTTGKLFEPNNTTAIDPTTGKLTGTNAATTEVAGPTTTPVVGGNGKYVEYRVYVAASGTTPIAAANGLNATVTTDASALKHIHNAVTIDFWVSAVTNGTSADPVYQGRTNLLAAKADGGSTVNMKNSVNSIPQLYGEGEAQANDTVDCLEIIMVVYFDGALEDGTTAADDTYVRNLTAVLDAAGFSVRFAPAS